MYVGNSQYKRRASFFLSRNLDFYDLPVDYSVYVLPRKYKWLNQQENRTVMSRYSVVGMGIETEDQLGLFDGLNEHGLMGVVHYLEGFAAFNTRLRRDKLNISAYNFMLFALTQFRSTDEIVSHLKTINLMASDLELTDGPPPLHWIFTDQERKTVVIESTDDGLKVYDNLVGAFSNSQISGGILLT